jgi:hypothetical protein
VAARRGRGGGSPALLGNWHDSRNPGYDLVVTDELTSHLGAEPVACPFVAFEDDRDHRSDAPDYRHRCFASAEPEPRAFPHQERYCLGAGFTACPVFLDWAQQEAAGVLAAAAAASDRAGSDEEDETAPAFLAGRPRPSVAAEAVTASRRTEEASAGLWANEGTARRSTPTAPPPPNSLVVPPVAMARRGPTHPGWENPPRLENFPRLRSRDERHSNAPLMGAAIGVAIVFVALVLVPLFLSGGGGSATLKPSSSALASGVQEGDISAATPTPTITPTVGPTPFLYTVQGAKIDPNLTAIAYRYNVTVAMIVAYNDYNGGPALNPNVIYEGMQFYIPPPGWTAPPATPTPSPTDTPTPTPTPAS